MMKWEGYTSFVTLALEIQLASPAMMVLWVIAVSPTPDNYYRQYAKEYLRCS